MNMTNREFDKRAFRDCLSEFATGVTVATTSLAGDRRIGVTVSSFNSVSIDPPLVLFSLSRSANSLSVFLKNRRFAINVLNEEQCDLPSRFARKDEDRWSGVNWDLGSNGCPVSPEALAVFECDYYADYDGGDHTILVGKVTRFERNSRSAPLVFFRGRFHYLSQSL